MKTIVKGTTPSPLISANSKGWSWDEFTKNDHKGYEDVRNQALSEQNNECAYTGIRLSAQSSIRVHLDHFRKKSLYPKLRFDYNNLFAAAKDLPFGSDFKDKQIHGPIQNSDKQYTTFWSPLHQGLGNMFWYRQDGFMEPLDNLSITEKSMAQSTIDMYNLNHDDLKKRRESIISIIASMSDQDDDTVRTVMSTTGFSFLVEIELNKRK